LGYDFQISFFSKKNFKKKWKMGDELESCGIKIKRLFMNWFTLLVLFFLIQISITHAQDLDVDKNLSGFLQRYVENGRVDYAGIKHNPQELKSRIVSFSNVKIETYQSWSELEKLSYLINYYNLATIELVVENYPIDSIKDIGNWLISTWSIKFITLFNEKISLDNLEHDIIRKQFNEPRIHLALVCAAKGCPPLRSESYRAEILNEQLENQAKNYLSSSNGLIIDEQKQTIFISSIFKWYAEDFESVPDFIQKYTSTSIKTYSIRYLDYDWSLNEK